MFWRKLLYATDWLVVVASVCVGLSAGGAVLPNRARSVVETHPWLVFVVHNLSVDLPGDYLYGVLVGV